MDRLHVLQQTTLVLPPFVGQLIGHGELAAAKLQCHLEAVAERVVEVLHTAIQLIPIRAVRNAPHKCLVATISLSHLRMIIRIKVRQMLEHLVIRC